jgi:hypothetical protein
MYIPPDGTENTTDGISCQVSHKKREQAGVLADEAKKTFGERKRVGFSNSIWFGNAHLGCRENKHNNFNYIFRQHQKSKWPSAMICNIEYLTQGASLTFKNDLFLM